jgi:hypothetical protein
MEFKVGEEELLRVLTTKGVIRFNIKGKPSLQYFGPFIKCYECRGKAILLS